MSQARILAIGAHPDDVDIKVGGTTALWKQAGCEVLLISATDGSGGHHEQKGMELAKRRKAEAAAAGKVAGCEYRVLQFPDGGLVPNLENRLEIIRLIRNFKPELVLTHRPNDYHPDHRYTSQLVQDSAYMVTVPAICPETPHLRYNPVFGYFADDFQKPIPFQADVVVDIGSVFSTVMSMLHCHESQFYEWLPYNQVFMELMPKECPDRKGWLEGIMRKWLSPLADRFRSKVMETYGSKLGQGVQLIEAFEISEYGASLNEEKKARLFPFLPRG
ncbi:MAG: PIG-L family deacetylase [Gemmataceae bacterium]|nr:PIG-L family deacetylase [Gemmataceae bacterium]